MVKSRKSNKSNKYDKNECYTYDYYNEKFKSHYGFLSRRGICTLGLNTIAPINRTLQMKDILRSSILHYYTADRSDRSTWEKIRNIIANLLFMSIKSNNYKDNNDKDQKNKDINWSKWNKNKDDKLPIAYMNIIDLVAILIYKDKNDEYDMIGNIYMISISCIYFIISALSLRVYYNSNINSDAFLSISFYFIDLIEIVSNSIYLIQLLNTSNISIILKEIFLSLIHYSYMIYNGNQIDLKIAYNKIHTNNTKDINIDNINNIILDETNKNNNDQILSHIKESISSQTCYHSSFYEYNIRVDKIYKALKFDKSKINLINDKDKDLILYYIDQKDSIPNIYHDRNTSVIKSSLIRIKLRKMEIDYNK